MKYIKKYQNQILIGKQWINIGIFTRERLVEEVNLKEDTFEVHNFKDLVKFSKCFYGIDKEIRLFSHRPYVKVQFGITDHWNITERYFQKHHCLQFRTVYSDFNPSMKWLVENLSAEDFMEYAKDRGWNNINLIASK